MENDHHAAAISEYVYNSKRIVSALMEEQCRLFVICLQFLQFSQRDVWKTVSDQIKASKTYVALTDSKKHLTVVSAEPFRLQVAKLRNVPGR
jgi:uncharacterized membrane protein